MNKVLGTCKCPLPWCGEDGAEIREGEKGKAYLVCDGCGSLVRSPVRKAQQGMRALVAASPAPAPEREAPPAAAKPEKKKSGGLPWMGA